MTWLSKTKQFNLNEMSALEEMQAAPLARALVNSSPVIALRGVAEVMLNGAEEKLHQLLADTPLTERWQSFTTDSGLDARDYEYAKQLNEKLGQK
jgi:hypothetical protein